MNRILATMVMVFGLLLLAGCVKKHSEDKQEVKIEKRVNANYMGQHNGCVQHYDPLFCPKKYAPKKGE
jgi:hypothetical protein